MDTNSWSSKYGPASAFAPLSILLQELA